MGGTSALSVTNFGTDASVPTPLNATTVITGSVGAQGSDKVFMTLASGYKIDSATVTISSYSGAAAQTSALTFYFQQSNGAYPTYVRPTADGQISVGSSEVTGGGQSTVGLSAYSGGFFVEITPPVGSMAGAPIPGPFGPQAGPSTPIYGSANYVITLNISRIIVTVPIAELAGSYIGLVQSDSKFQSRIAQIVSATPVKPIPNEALGARLDMTVTANGTVTGKLVYGPTQVPFSTIFTTSTVNSVVVTQPKLVIPIPAYNRSLVLNFGTDDEDEGYMYGALVQQGDELDKFLTNTRGWKNTWTTARRPGSNYTSYKTFSMDGWFSNGEGGAPQGTSFGSVKAEAAVGTYLAAGTLADGQKFTSTGFYGPSGDFLIYQYLYASLGKGSFSGSASVNSNQAFPANVQEADFEVQVPTIRGGFTWIKNPSPATTSAAPGRPKRFSRPVPIAGPSDTLYPEGFEGSGGIYGGTYTPPAAGQVLNVSGERNVVLNTTTTNTNTTNISFNNYQRFGAVNFGGTVAITSLGAASRANRITVNLSTFSGTAVSGLTFQSFDAATGLFKGSFKVTPPLRTINFEGIFVYNPEGNYYTGAGYFISNRFETSAGPPVMSRQRVSGSVSIGYRNDG